MAVHAAEARKAEKVFKEQLQVFELSLSLAVANDPSSGGYQTDPGGNLQKRDRERLNQRIQACSENLVACDRALGVISKLGVQHPFLEVEAKAAQEKKERIQTLRQHLGAVGDQYRRRGGGIGL